MEWVEITAKTIEEARELALDQLGIDDQDAEIEVLEEPKAGLFGRTRGQARVRARVKPTAVRPKVERRERRKRADKPAGTTSDRTPKSDSDGSQSTDGSVDDRAADETGDTTDAPTAERAPRNRGGRGRGEGSNEDRSGNGRAAARKPGSTGGEAGAVSELTIDQQAEVVADFLKGLASRFGAEGSATTIERVEDDTVEIRLDGGDLGLLIGPKGQTLHLVQELARTMVQRRGGGIQEGRIRIDIAGYREKRRAALTKFTEQVAAQVLESGSQKALEPMNPADRKVVHDTVNGIEGVRTISEGEDSRRRVVILLDA